MDSPSKRGIYAEKSRLLNGKQLERSKEKLYTDNEIEYAASILNADERLIKKMRKQFDV
ncbi:hypothetical protein JCM19046_3065 [Bacillus sp. JCM 19046]|nr:hypothetical protein JCM19045_352 [Bacillus sp. JCM 19045]GAF18486.1 hypothetical protein JCM19046_3065 [Bacillus sp. JCM 19046]